MSLKQTIDADIKTAMLAKDQDTLRALRSIKSMILLAETEKGNEGELSSDRELQLLTKAAKQRKESAEMFKQQNRDDLYTKEMDELRVIEKYLPKALSPEEAREKVKSIIDRLGATNPSEMGKVMGVASKELAGQVDGGTLSGLVKAILSGN